jgi:hypothetical protein
MLAAGLFMAGIGFLAGVATMVVINYISYRKWRREHG